MAATMTQVAKRVGVSVTLVSRLLRNDPTLRISDDRRRQILEEAERLGGVKTRNASRGSGSANTEKKTGTILVPINRMFNAEPFLAEFLQSGFMKHLESTLGDSDYHLHLSFFEPGEDYEYVKSVIESGNRCDGLFLPSGMIDARMEELLLTSKFPHVTMSNEAEHRRVNMVRGHTAAGYRLAVNHLVERGHRRIGFVGTPRSYRYPLFIAAAAGAEMEVPRTDCCFAGKLDPGSPLSAERTATASAFEAWWRTGEHDDLTAVVCSNDRMAFGVLDAMQTLGLEAPRDLSVIGYDNIEAHGPEKVKQPILTTIDNPFDRIGRRMAELLLNQILHSQTDIVHERIPADMLIRQTTGPAPGKGNQ